MPCLCNRQMYETWQVAWIIKRTHLLSSQIACCSVLMQNALSPQVTPLFPDAQHKLSSTRPGPADTDVICRFGDFAQEVLDAFDCRLGLEQGAETGWLSLDQIYKVTPFPAHHSICHDTSPDVELLKLFPSGPCPELSNHDSSACIEVGHICLWASLYKFLCTTY